MNDLKTVLGTKYPIIVGPMAWTTLVPLVSAVANAGAVGILGAWGATIEDVEHQIQETKARANRPFGINLMLKADTEDYVKQITDLAEKYDLKYIYADDSEFVGFDKPLAEKWFKRCHC